MSQFEDSQEGKEESRDRVRYDLHKSNFFRVVHADGVWGGLTPQLNIAMGFFSEQGALPQQIVHEITPEGNVGPEVPDERVTRNAIAREVEVSVVLSIEAARYVLRWLEERISQAEAVREAAKEGAG